MSEGNKSDGDAPSLRVSACDNCRTRKIKCDRRAPCASCKTASVVCRTTKRPVEKKQRVLVSGRYEREIESVNGRLSGLERTLQTLVGKSHGDRVSTPASTARLEHLSTSGVESLSGSRLEPLSTPQDSQIMERGLEYEGDSSFATHSKQIARAFEKSLDSTRYPAPSQDLSTTVATLKSLLSGHPGASLPRDQPLQEVVHYHELSNLTLPPPQLVLRLLRHIKTRPHRFFFDMPTIDAQGITSLCQKVYFPTEEYTIAAFITVHVSLYYLFRDLAREDAQELNLSRADIDEVAAVCATNAETALRNVRLFTDSQYDNIEALVLGVLIAIDLGRPAFGWILCATAARMAQDAGYHRLPPYAVAPEASKKRLLFWMLYSIDRSLSLNIGRAATVQDCDLTVDRPRIPEELDPSWGDMFLVWFDFAQVQGEIYDQLYCARAQSQTAERKAEIARRLATRLNDLHVRLGRHPADTPFGRSWDETLVPIHIIFSSTLTLVYRMIPPDNLPEGRSANPLRSCDEALVTARRALMQLYQEWSSMEDRTDLNWGMSIHWTLLWCPFVPFIVIFGNTIVNRSVEDLGLLRAVLETLQEAAKTSTGVAKLYRACRMFFEIADMYLAHSDVARGPAHDSPRSSQTPGSPAHHHDGNQPVTMPPLGQPLDTPSDDILLPDLPLTYQDWDGVLDQWNLGVGTDSAREMSSVFVPYMTGAGAIPDS